MKRSFIANNHCFIYQKLCNKTAVRIIRQVSMSVFLTSWKSFQNYLSTGEHSHIDLYLVIRTLSLSTKECGNWEQFGRKYVALKGTIVPWILLFSVFPSWRYDFSSGSSQVLSFYMKFLHSLTWKSWNKLDRLIIFSNKRHCRRRLFYSTGFVFSYLWQELVWRKIYDNFVKTLTYEIQCFVKS